MRAIALTYPQDLPDGELAGRVLAALRRDGYVKSDDLHVFVEGGVVTLLGTVDTPFERHEATRIAAWTPGVRWVDSQLAVAIDQDLSDDELLARVERALDERGLLSPSLSPRIRRGVVQLVGQVASLAEERAAVAAAEQVKGVREVVSALTIPRTLPDGPGPMLDDSLLLSEANEAIAGAGARIYDNQSVVRHGVLRLRGLVPNARTVWQALDAVYQVPGLRGVRNELALQANPASKNRDEALTGQVIQALRDDGRVSPSQVMPTAASGEVILTGQVDSIEDHDAALQVAASLPEVTEVVDDIQILGRSPLRADDRRVQRYVPTTKRHGGHGR